MRKVFSQVPHLYLYSLSTWWEEAGERRQWWGSWDTLSSRELLQQCHFSQPLPLLPSRLA